MRSKTTHRPGTRPETDGGSESRPTGRRRAARRGRADAGLAAGLLQARLRDRRRRRHRAARAADVDEPAGGHGVEEHGGTEATFWRADADDVAHVDLHYEHPRLGQSNYAMQSAGGRLEVDTTAGHVVGDFEPGDEIEYWFTVISADGTARTTERWVHVYGE